MFIDISQLTEITINGKKKWINDETLNLMITADVDKSFGDIHSYTVGENTSAEDTERMIHLMNDYSADAPIKIQYLLLEFIEKYYKNPVQEILRLIGSKNVLALYNYFLYGPCHYTYDFPQLEFACEYSLIEMDKEILPKYLWPNHQAVKVITDDDGIPFCYGTYFIIPSERYASIITEYELDNFRKNAFEILSMLSAYKNIYYYRSICGVAFSSRLFNLDNFDLASWIANEPVKKTRKPIKQIPKRLPKKNHETLSEDEDSDDE